MSKLIFPNDKIMQTAYEQVISHFGELPEVPVLKPSEYFTDLCEAIIGQQLSEKVAPIIRAKVRALLPNGEITPEAILATDVETFRKGGPSYSKISYMKNLAEAWLNGSIKYTEFEKLDNEEIIKELSAVKGIGRWTAEMFLMFGLARTDIFSVGDYGLKRSMMRLYKLSDKTKPAKFLTISEKWAPNRSLASRILWRHLELPG